MKTSQHAKILSFLESGNWVCSSKFYAEYIADPRTRLCELKKQGYGLISRWCLSHHHDGKMKEWRLISSPTSFNSVVKSMEQELSDKVARWNAQFKSVEKVKNTLF